MSICPYVHGHICICIHFHIGVCACLWKCTNKCPFVYMYVCILYKCISAMLVLMCLFLYIYMYMYMHVYLGVSVRVCVHVFLWVYVYQYFVWCSCAHVCICLYVCKSLRMFVCVCLSVYLLICLFVCLFVCVFVVFHCLISILMQLCMVRQIRSHTVSGITRRPNRTGESRPKTSHSCTVMKIETEVAKRHPCEIRKFGSAATGKARCGSMGAGDVGSWSAVTIPPLWRDKAAGSQPKAQFAAGASAPTLRAKHELRRRRAENPLP